MSHEDETRLLSALERKNAHARAFRQFSRTHWSDGKLSSRDKHIVAVAVGQVTRCEYCIEHHAEIARQLGATLDELLAAAYITAAIETIETGEIAVSPALDVDVKGSVIGGSSVGTSRDEFVAAILQNDTLPLELRLVSSATVAFAQRRDALRRTFHQLAIDHGVSPDALDEGYAIAAVLRAGAVYAHTLAIAKVFDR
ncbi:carboxymuconolactone decarboxylase family protein [Paraburkholderia sp.]|uniref:carboxymuconolactone decarboxylase family protein n=1 Tax=Paraburkholderia sp. TaxID=1926495 RepID=UPI002396318E|nr:carboxymuconolactone decarboxylase family protein [Paraburkholderia sp.]MDE1180871.1 carboxymuconolactone decarboxylase family protein [Paraburkholderia sp.]